MFLNLGDSYYNYRPGEGQIIKKQSISKTLQDNPQNCPRRATKISGLKEKDLVGIPWRVALALQETGWVLRSEIIWQKKNPTPESVKDRPTRSHEQIFMLSKATWRGEPKRQFDFISDADARWLALFLDTEGNICAKRAKVKGKNDSFGAQTCFANTSFALLESARKIIGTGSILKRAGKNSPMFYYQLSNNQAADLLHRLYPFLLNKQRQASLAIHLQQVISKGNSERKTKVGRLRGRTHEDSYTDELVKIWETMKKLNHFGAPDLKWVPSPKFGKWKSEHYYYDAEAVKEPIAGSTAKRVALAENRKGKPKKGEYKKCDKARVSVDKYADGRDHLVCAPKGETRNRRSVWTVSTRGYKGAHFATFPEDLITPCILAGCPEGGVVLDPFMGSGTTAVVALKNKRKAIGIELNPDYGRLSIERVKNWLCSTAKSKRQVMPKRKPVNLSRGEGK